MIAPAHGADRPEGSKTRALSKTVRLQNEIRIGRKVGEGLGGRVLRLVGFTALLGRFVR